MNTPETTKFNKSAFIRARPTMKPTEIIAEAEKLGQGISPGAIWTLRSSDKRKAEGKSTPKAKKKVAKVEAAEETPKAKKKVAKKVTPKATKKKVAKKATPKVAKKEASGKKFNKSEFIRKYAKLGAGEIIEKAAARGQVITSGMIYTLRSADKRAAAGGKTSNKVAKKSKVRSFRQLKVKTVSMGTDSPFNGGSVTGRPSIAFDPSDPAALKFIASALAANA